MRYKNRLKDPNFDSQEVLEDVILDGREFFFFFLGGGGRRVVVLGECGLNNFFGYFGVANLGSRWVTPPCFFWGMFFFNSFREVWPWNIPYRAVTRDVRIGRSAQTDSSILLAILQSKGDIKSLIAVRMNLDAGSLTAFLKPVHSWNFPSEIFLFKMSIWMLHRTLLVP